MTAPASLVYFGDSFTDGGALFAATSKVLAIPFPIASAGYAGVFSNGPVYAQVAPALLGAGVQNYAVGGARAVGSRALQEFITVNGGEALVLPGAEAADLAFDTNLGAQVGRFLAESAAAGGVAPKTTASILIGLNDYGNFVPSSPETALAEAAALVNAVVTATLGAASAVLAAGVQSVVLNTLPSFRTLAASALTDEATLALGDQIVAAHNAALADGAAALRGLGLSVTVVDFGAMAAAFAEDLPTHGVIAPLGAPILLGDAGNPDIDVAPDGEITLSFPPNPLVAGLDPDQVAYFDFLHPSAAAHGVFGAFQAAALTTGVRFLGAAADHVVGSGAAEVVFGGAGNDILTMRGGADIAFGGLGDDRLCGDNGRDILSGGAGDDVVHGGSGADVVAGGRGDDTVTGGKGDDVLIDGLGSDVLLGGRGRDTFLYTEAALIGGTTGVDCDFFDGGAGRDMLVLALSAGTRAAVEAELAASCGPVRGIAALGLTLRSIETIRFVDDRADLATVATTARLAEADLWGLV
jgi:Ca2+-binding RTX toxin-like protein